MIPVDSLRRVLSLVIAPTLPLLRVVPWGYFVAAALGLILGSRVDAVKEWLDSVPPLTVLGFATPAVLLVLLVLVLVAAVRLDQRIAAAAVPRLQITYGLEGEYAERLYEEPDGVRVETQRTLRVAVENLSNITVDDAAIKLESCSPAPPNINFNLELHLLKDLSGHQVLPAGWHENHSNYTGLADTAALPDQVHPPSRFPSVCGPPLGPPSRPRERARIPISLCPSRRSE